MKDAEGGFVLKDAPANKNAADGKEAVNAVAAVATDACVGMAQKVPELVVGHEDAEDGHCAPAVETGQIAALALRCGHGGNNTSAQGLRK